MSEFSEAAHVTAINEGGFANSQHDAGKLTYAGISQVYWPKWQGWPYVLASMAKHNMGATAADVSAINADMRSNPTVVQLVNAFYMANFWNVNSLSGIVDQQVADNVYDSGVNQGTGMAAHFLQNAINGLLGAGTVVSDGAVGPKTLAAANRCDQEKLFDAINAERLASYQKDADWPYFHESWTSRLGAYQKAA